MAKKKSAAAADGELVISEKFRTTPIKSTNTHIKGLHSSAILYKCQASSYWQFRAFMEGKRRKCTTKEIELDRAQRKAKLIYAGWLNSINNGEIKTEPSTRMSLDVVARSLWTKNETRIKNGELHKDKVSKDKYIYESHIKPFFKNYDLKNIYTDQLEQFKSYLADKDLSAGSQLSYINLVMALLKEAHTKRLIPSLPHKPRMRIDEGVRGYFNKEELSKLRDAAYKNIGNTFDFVDANKKIYRKTRITEELGLLIDFMVETYIRPTDIKVIQHQNIELVEKAGITFLVLAHGMTKLHKKKMVSTELGVGVYSKIIKYREKYSGFNKTDHLFLPEFANRDSALQNLSTQFSALLHMIGMAKDNFGKPRTLYSLRHTAIVQSLGKGVPIELVASNARTSVIMIRRFYGVHIDNVLETGTIYVEKEKAIRDSRLQWIDDLIAEMKDVSDTPEIYTFSANSMEADEVNKLKKQISKSQKNDMVNYENKPMLKNSKLDKKFRQRKPKLNSNN